MKKFLKIILILIAALVVFAIACAIYGYIKMGPTQKEAKEFAAQTALAIAPEWNVEAMRKQGDSAFNDYIQKQDLVAMTADLKKQYGAFKKIKDTDCPNIQVGMVNGHQAVAQCVVNAEFEQDDAVISLIVHKTLGGDWKMENFNVTRKYLKK